MFRIEHLRGRGRRRKALPADPTEIDPNDHRPFRPGPAPRPGCVRRAGDEAPARVIDVRKAEELGRRANLSRLRASSVPARVERPTRRIEQCDFRQLEITGATVDAVVCDPPYTGESQSLWSDLSAGGHVRRSPGDSSLPMWEAGVPGPSRRLGEHLDYVWTGATYQPGRSSTICSLMVRTWWRPWIPPGRSFPPPAAADDTLVAEGRGEKGPTDHPWRQTIGPFAELVAMVSEPGSHRRPISWSRHHRGRGHRGRAPLRRVRYRRRRSSPESRALGDHSVTSVVPLRPLCAHQDQPPRELIRGPLPLAGTQTGESAFAR